MSDRNPRSPKRKRKKTTAKKARPVLKKRKAAPVRRKPKPWQSLKEPNKEVVRMICALFRKGVPHSTIARFICTTETRLKAWLNRGEAAIEEESEEEEDLIYMQLYLQSSKAAAYFEAVQVQELTLPGNKFWRQRLAILERADPRNWARTSYEDLGEEEEVNPDESFL